ncbi:hypothetical protein LguiB_027826 [Lonicera macranthoides]
MNLEREKGNKKKKLKRILMKTKRYTDRWRPRNTLDKLKLQTPDSLWSGVPMPS